MEETQTSSFTSHGTTDEDYMESDGFSSGIDTDVNEGDACWRKLFLLAGVGRPSAGGHKEKPPGEDSRTAGLGGLHEFATSTSNSFQDAVVMG